MTNQVRLLFVMKEVACGLTSRVNEGKQFRHQEITSKQSKDKCNG